MSNSCKMKSIVCESEYGRSKFRLETRLQTRTSTPNWGSEMGRNIGLFIPTGHSVVEKQFTFGVDEV